MKLSIEESRDDLYYKLMRLYGHGYKDIDEYNDKLNTIINDSVDVEDDSLICQLTTWYNREFTIECDYTVINGYYYIYSININIVDNN